MRNAFPSIGDTVRVTVDRPVGSRHPKHHDTIYTVNYGYIEGTLSPDGEGTDAYILGVCEPKKHFTGKVIAIIHRLDDIEDKLVVAPSGVTFTPDEIKEMTAFCERYFESIIITE